MDTSTIAGIALEALQIIGMLIGYFLLSKKGKVSDLSKILEAIPVYIAEANAQIPNATTAVKISYILAEIKEDCKEMGIKYCEKKIKSKVEEGLANETQNSKTN